MLSLLPLLVVAPPAGPHIGLTAADHAGAPTFRADQPVVGTYFFFWYNDRTREHFVNGDGSDALTTHMAPTPGVPYAYDQVAWWRHEIEVVRQAGVDFIAPVYWGNPGDEGWSKSGIRTLAKLIAEQQAAGEPVMPTALFYDTSTLQHNPQNYHAELDTERGKLWFYETIRDFFSMLPPSSWARIDGRPVIILYAAAFAKTLDPALFPDMKQRFVADFGVEPYLIKHTGWPGEADAEITWGGALGLKIVTTAAVGPGYDHSHVPGRQPLVVDRQGGQFYRDNWTHLLQRSLDTRPRLVMVETWNEFHEGTDVAPSVEYGNQYVELTREFADHWHANDRLKPTGAFAGATSVHWTAGGEKPGGITIGRQEDGPNEPGERAGRKCVVTTKNRFGDIRYLYVDVDNSFVYDEKAPKVKLTLTYLDAGTTPVELHYDSLDNEGSVRAGAFKPGGRFTLGNSGEWKTVSFELEDARFGDRTNGADLRLAVFGGDLAVAEVVVDRLQ